MRISNNEEIALLVEAHAGEKELGQGRSLEVMVNAKTSKSEDGFMVPKLGPSMALAAWYEDAEKVEKAAKARGFTGNDGESWHDFVEAENNRFATRQMFKNLDAAVQWLQSEIVALKSVYGVGNIRLVESVPRRERCQYCCCDGIRGLHEWTVSDTGIETDEGLQSLCHSDEE